MERFLCLDIGDKRIGVAVSDPFNAYALPVETYRRQNLKLDLTKIGEYVKDKCATAIVCGLPVNFDGTASIQTQKAKFFIDRLKETLKIPVYSVDERCTTVEAEETLKAQGKSRQEIKSAVDSLAAAEILKGFLNEYNKSLKKGEEKMEKEHKHGKGCDCGCEDEVHEHCDCGCEDEIVELTTDEGKKLKFYVVGTIEYKGKTYSAFEPAEEIEGLEEDDLVIFELSGEDEEAELLPIEDEALLDEVFQEFCKALDEEEAAAEAESLEPDAE
ncbi:MAG: Holliday junction resolvase RuvX [Clostridia bacterium]|nr:Holliday junction resolvase RuvX [Clostridia bacterium]